MTIRLVTHDDETGACGQSLLPSYPKVEAGYNVTVDITSTLDGQTIYIVNGQAPNPIIEAGENVNISTDTAADGTLTYTIAGTDSFDIYDCLEIGSFVSGGEVKSQSMLGVTGTGTCRKITEIPQSQVYNVQKNLFEEIIQDCLDIRIPDVSNTCGTVQQLVLIQDETSCFSFATYNSNIVTGSGTWGDTVTHLPLNDDIVYDVPLNFADPSDYYNISDLRADDNAGNGAINEVTVMNSRLTHIEFENPCDKEYVVEIEGTVKNSATVDEAYSRIASFVMRYRVDGGIWTYPRNNAGVIQSFFTLNGLSREYSANIKTLIPTGDIEIDVIYVANQDGVNPPPVILRANTNVSGVNVGSPRATVRQSF